MAIAERDHTSLVDCIKKNTIGRFADNPDGFFNRRILFGDIIPLVLDNLPFPTVVAETTGYNSQLLERVIPLEVRRNLVHATRDWVVGETKGKVFIVGQADTGSNHPHMFEIMKVEDGLRLLFVDPEDNVGKRNRFKPAVMVLGAAKISDDEKYTTQFSFHRYRSTHLRKDEKTLQAQYRIAEKLVGTDGPFGMLGEHQEDILFQLVLSSRGSVLRARYTLPQQARNVIHGNRGVGLQLERRFSAIKDTFGLFQEALGSVDENSERYAKVINSIKKQQTDLGIKSDQ